MNPDIATKFGLRILLVLVGIGYSFPLVGQSVHIGMTRQEVQVKLRGAIRYHQYELPGDTTYGPVTFWGLQGFCLPYYDSLGKVNEISYSTPQNQRATIGQFTSVKDSLDLRFGPAKLAGELPGVNFQWEVGDVIYQLGDFRAVIYYDELPASVYRWYSDPSGVK